MVYEKQEKLNKFNELEKFLGSTTYKLSPVYAFYWLVLGLYPYTRC